MKITKKQLQKLVTEALQEHRPEVHPDSYVAMMGKPGHALRIVEAALHKAYIAQMEFEKALKDDEAFSDKTKSEYEKITKRYLEHHNAIRDMFEYYKGMIIKMRGKQGGRRIG